MLARSPACLPSFCRATRAHLGHGRFSVRCVGVACPGPGLSVRRLPAGDGGDDGHDESDDVQFEDVAAADEVGDDAADDRDEDAEGDCPQQPIF